MWRYEKFEGSIPKVAYEINFVHVNSVYKHTFWIFYVWWVLYPDMAPQLNVFYGYRIIDDIMSDGTNKTRFLQKKCLTILSVAASVWEYIFLYIETIRNNKGAFIESILYVIGDLAELSYLRLPRRSKTSTIMSHNFNHGLYRSDKVFRCCLENNSENLLCCSSVNVCVTL